MGKQVVLIGGGKVFDDYNKYLDYLNNYKLSLDGIGARTWTETLKKYLPEHQVIFPKMPNDRNARYAEWKIWLDKLFPLLSDGVILVGYSLGGITLAKYLSENKVPVRIAATCLVAAPFDDEGNSESLGDFILPISLELLNNQGGNIFLYYSEDDPVEPQNNLDKYKDKIPKAVVKLFKNKGHFRQEQFPELVEDIKSI